MSEEITTDKQSTSGSEKHQAINKYLTHQPMKYGKKLYLSEVIAERFIQAIAILSIGIIVAIFYFVFHESIYAFIHESDKSEVAQGISNNTDASPQQESYGDAPETADAPESYGDTPSASTPESYGDTPSASTPESYGSSSSSDAPESYGDTEQAGSEKVFAPPTSGSESTETSAEDKLSVEMMGEKPQKISDFIFPNDTIQGKPEYIWQPVSEKPKYSMIPLFLGSIKVTAIGIAVAAPIAILAAIFMTAFAPRRMKEILKPVIEIIAGFPSVVIGFFCLITLATIFQDFFGNTYRLNAFVAGIGIAIAVIPIIFTVAEDSMSFVPSNLKEASLALGASRWQTAFHVVLPAALPGIFAAIILGFGRAFGETMIVLMATGNAALMSLDIFEPVRTLSATIGAEMAEVEFHGVHYGVLFLIGSFLFVFTFTLNAIAEFFVKKALIKKFQGK